MSKPFFYRLDAARYLSEMARITDDAERGKVALAFAFDLVDGKGNSQYSRSIIAEAKAFSSKKSEAGKKGMNNRWLKNNTVITEDNTDIAVLPFDITNAVITRSSSSSSNKKHIYDDGFEKLWEVYPNKDGKKSALKHFRASVTTRKDCHLISYALTSYLDHLRQENWKKPKNGSTWFNNWRDWIPEGAEQWAEEDLANEQ